MLLDGHRVAREFEDVLVVEREAMALGVRDVDGAHRAARRAGSNSILISFEPIARRMIGNLPAASIGLWT